MTEVSCRPEQRDCRVAEVRNLFQELHIDC